MQQDPWYRHQEICAFHYEIDANYKPSFIEESLEQLHKYPIMNYKKIVSSLNKMVNDEQQMIFFIFLKYLFTIGMLLIVTARWNSVSNWLTLHQQISIKRACPCI